METRPRGAAMPRVAYRDPVTMSGRLTARIMFAGRSASLSAQIVDEVRQQLFAKALRPGDFLGTERDLAARFGTSRIVARDALRTLEALGIVEIRMGKGGGARIAAGNPRLFAEAPHNRVLVVQLISLEHVSWPRRNVTATPRLARHVLDVHARLTDLIELRDAAAARTLMDDHVKMIRARRVAEHAHDEAGQACC